MVKNRLSVLATRPIESEWLHYLLVQEHAQDM